MDREASAAGKLAKIVATPTSASALTLATGGVPGATAAAPLSMEHLGIIRDYMASTLHIPYYKNKDHYICLAATNALRGLKKDPDFIAWHVITSYSIHYTKLYDWRPGKVSRNYRNNYDRIVWEKN